MRFSRSGFWGWIVISLRRILGASQWFLGSDHNFAAQHPQGEPKARGICALTPKTPDSEFISPFGLSLSKPYPVRPEVLKDRAEPVEAFCLIQSPRSLQSPDAALSPRRATHFSFASPKVK